MTHDLDGEVLHGEGIMLLDQDTWAGRSRGRPTGGVRLPAPER